MAPVASQHQNRWVIETYLESLELVSTPSVGMAAIPRPTPILETIRHPSKIRHVGSHTEVVYPLLLSVDTTITVPAATQRIVDSMMTVRRVDQV